MYFDLTLVWGFSVPSAHLHERLIQVVLTRKKYLYKHLLFNNPGTVLGRHGDMS